VTQTFGNAGTLNAVGTPCAPIAIFSSVNGSNTSFSKQAVKFVAIYLYLKLMQEPSVVQPFQLELTALRHLQLVLAGNLLIAVVHYNRL
jgi:hypothetical protein